VEVGEGIAVGVSVGRIGVCVAVREGVTGVKVSVTVGDPDEPRQPTRSSKSNEDAGRSLDMGLLSPKIIK